MNKYVKTKESTHWKDRAAGWHQWKIFIKECRECKKKDTFYTLQGTEEEVKRFASDQEKDLCDSCW